MKKLSSLIFIIPLVLVLGLGAAFLNRPSNALGAGGTILKANISTGVSVGTSSTQLLSASSGRTYAVIVNDSANVVYIAVDGNPAVVGQGIRLNASGGSYEINSLNQFVAAINAISGTPGSNVTVTAAQ